MQGIQEQERVLMMYRERWLDPEPDKEEQEKCSVCGKNPKYLINHAYYCRSCIEDTEDISQGNVYCDECDTLIEKGEKFYTVWKENICNDCLSSLCA